MDNKPEKTITVGLIVGWIVGPLLILVAITNIFSDPLAGLLFLLGGLLSLPPAAASTERRTGVKLSKGLRVLLVLVCLFAAGAAAGGESNSGTPSLAGQDVETEPPAAAEPMLEIQSFRVYREYDFAHIDGMVKNITDQPLESVMAVGEFYAADGTFVKSADALIDYNPILPGQSSPFEVLTTDNPAIVNGAIVFKKFWGGTIPTRQAADQ